MTRTLIIGDVHDKWSTVTPTFNRMIQYWRPDRTIILGDLTNDWYQTAKSEYRQLRIMERWAKSIRGQGIDLTILIGNHDVYYLVSDKDHSIAANTVNMYSPGHHQRFRQQVGLTIRSVRPEAMTTITGCGRKWLLSHAGMTGAWSARIGLDTNDVDQLADHVNMMFHDRNWGRLYMVGPGRGGDEVPSPIWADRSELEADPMPGVDQMVGHTPAVTVESRTTDDGHVLVFCDTMSTNPDNTPIGDSSMLVMDDDRAFRTWLEDNEVASEPFAII